MMSCYELKTEKEIVEEYNSSTGEENTIRFLLNSMLLAGIGVLDFRSCQEIVVAISNCGQPPIETFVKMSSMASQVLRDAIESESADRGLN